MTVYHHTTTPATVVRASSWSGPMAWLTPPSDAERDQYLARGQHRWLFWAQAVAMVGVAVSLFGLATNTPEAGAKSMVTMWLDRLPWSLLNTPRRVSISNEDPTSSSEHIEDPTIAELQNVQVSLTYFGGKNVDGVVPEESQYGDLIRAHFSPPMQDRVHIISKYV